MIRIGRRGWNEYEQARTTSSLAEVRLKNLAASKSECGVSCTASGDGKETQAGPTVLADVKLQVHKRKAMEETVDAPDENMTESNRRSAVEADNLGQPKVASHCGFRTFVTSSSSSPLGKRQREKMIPMTLNELSDQPSSR